MIAHRQEITGHAPGQDRRTVAGFHVRPDILEDMSATSLSIRLGALRR